MRALSKLLALTLTAALQPAVADVVTLDFEDITSLTQVGSHYGDIKFTSDAWGVTADYVTAGTVCNGDLFFQPVPTDGRNCGALINKSASGSNIASFTITSEFGFVDAISFAFALRDNTSARLDIYGSGGWLAGGDLIADPCRSAPLFCNWVEEPIEFSGVASSIVFTSADSKLMIDNLSLTTAPATGRLPEPGSIALAFGALGALGWSRRRAAR